jgi:two-component system alkaline phosphatase synthesis response regulator PhoP/two-component system response regulator VicR
MAGEKVLVIDDEPAMHRLLKVILEAEGFELVGPEEHGEARNSIKGKHPDLIILDIMMPEVDGFEILEGLKKDKETNNIPVIILSVRNLKEDISKALSLGADLYLTKPFDPSELLNAVRSVLSGTGSAN